MLMKGVTTEDAWLAVLKPLFERRRTAVETVANLEQQIERLSGQIGRAEVALDRHRQQSAEAQVSDRKWAADTTAWLTDARTVRLPALEAKTTAARAPEFVPAGMAATDFYREAARLSDKSETTGTWPRPTAIFARAFESWVYDQIANHGARSENLVQSLDQDRFAGSEFRGNPYPVGAEREVINAAFDWLFATMQERVNANSRPALSSRDPTNLQAGPGPLGYLSFPEDFLVGSSVNFGTQRIIRLARNVVGIMDPGPEAHERRRNWESYLSPLRRVVAPDALIRTFDAVHEFAEGRIGPAVDGAIFSVKDGPDGFGIALSISIPDPPAAYVHEAVHWLSFTGRITQDERNVFRTDPTFTGLRDRVDILYSDVGREAREEEYTAWVVVGLGPTAAILNAAASPPPDRAPVPGSGWTTRGPERDQTETIQLSNRRVTPPAATAVIEAIFTGSVAARPAEQRMLIFESGNGAAVFARDRRDTQTPDLFAWQPPKPPEPPRLDLPHHRPPPPPPLVVPDTGQADAPTPAPIAPTVTPTLPDEREGHARVEALTARWDVPTQPLTLDVGATSAPAITPISFAVTGPADLAPSGQTAKVTANLAALRVLNSLDATGRPATTAEQQTLAQYSGWGHSPQVFDEARADWAKARGEVQALLEPEAFEAARRTVLNAHYTSHEVIEAVWQGVRDLGFTGGRVLEPGCGIGNFIGTMPRDLAGSTRLIGVELDRTTAAIARHLYPEAEIRAEGFEKTRLPPGNFDLAIGNVPFGKFALHDPVHNKAGHSIHNHFIVKALDLAKPGAVVALITSRFTLDARTPSARRDMAEQADLLGAIRLPETAFRANAGTDAVTDLLILRKRRPGEEPLDQSWLATGEAPEATTGAGTVPIPINRIFLDHPTWVLGTLVVERGMYNANTLTVKPRPGALGRQIAEAMAEIVEHARAQNRTWAPLAQPSPATTTVTASEPAPERLKEGAFFVGTGGQVFISRYGNAEPLTLSDTDREEVTALIALRDTVADLLDLQSRDDAAPPLAGQSAETEAVPSWSETQLRLNRVYDAYVARYGPINRFQLVSRGVDEDGEETVVRRTPRFGGFRRDPDFASVIALEAFDDETQTAEKAPIFSRRVLNARREVRGADDAPGALLAVLERTGRVDLTAMADLLGAEEAQVIAELKGAIYRDPETQTWVTADAYLSGNVRRKLHLAEDAATANPDYRKNVAALRRVQPRDLTPREITAHLGAPWIPPADIEAFANHLLNTERIRVSFIPLLNAWTVEAPREVARSVVARTQWGTRRRDAVTLLEDALNGRASEVTDIVPDPNSGERRIRNPRETMAAGAKRQAIADTFSTWLWQDPERADRLAAAYNETFNHTVLRSFDGSHLRLPGLSATLTPRPHQRNVAWRVVQDGNTLMAHTVGAGKTLASIIAAMEEKRLGLVNKPAFVVPNHMLEQFAREFKQAYPRARLLIADKDAVSPDARKTFVARSAFGDWDAVLFTHNSFSKLPVSPAAQSAFIRSQLADLEAALRAAAAANDEPSPAVKTLERAKLKLEERLTELAATDHKDDGLCFEQTGIDRLYVDEIHLHKNLWFATRRPGVSVAASQRAQDLYLKKELLEARTPGRSLVGLTGTPIANRVAEMHVMQMFFDAGGMRTRGIAHFDAWAATYGEDVTAVELAPDGASYRLSTRFARYVNVPELLTHFRQFTDVQTTDMLNLPVPALRGGKPQVISVPASALQKAYIEEIKDRIERIRERKVDPTEDNMLKVTSDGRKCAADPRLLGLPAASDGGKAAVVGAEVARIYHETKTFEYPIAGSTRPSPNRGALQVVFCDLGTPKPDAFNLYDAITEAAVAQGVPRDRIRMIHDSPTDDDKARLFRDCRAGRVSVLIGSTEKMGVGTNIQDRLYALHDVDCPWRPVDIEQRHGRILRQGNLHRDLDIPVEIIIYGTEATFDVYMWQTAERKSRFIAQVMKGDLETREIEDIDGAALTCAEAKAILTGNPILMEKAGVDAEVAKLERAWRSHEEDQQHLKRNLATARATIEDRTRRILALEAAIAARHLPADEASTNPALALTVPGFAAAAWDGADHQLATIERAAGKALIDALRQEGMAARSTARGHHRTAIGQFAGFPLEFETGGVLGQTVIRMRLDSPAPIAIDVCLERLGKTPTGIAQLNALWSEVRDLPASLQLVRAELAEARRTLDQASAVIGRPFEAIDRLEALRTRQAEIAAQLAIDVPAFSLALPGEPAPETSDAVYDERGDFDNVERRSFKAGQTKGSEFLRRDAEGRVFRFDATPFCRELGRAADQTPPNRARALGLAHTCIEAGRDALAAAFTELDSRGYGTRDHYRGKAAAREFLVAAAAVHGWGRSVAPAEALTEEGWTRWSASLRHELALVKLAEAMPTGSLSLEALPRHDRDLEPVTLTEGFAAGMIAAATRLPAGLRADRSPDDLKAAVTAVAARDIKHRAADYERAVRQDLQYTLPAFFALPGPVQRSLHDTLPEDLRADYRQRHAAATDAFAARARTSRGGPNSWSAASSPLIPIAPEGQGILTTIRALLPPAAATDAAALPSARPVVVPPPGARTADHDAEAGFEMADD